MTVYTQGAVKAGSTGELGTLGYGVALLQVLGFAAGGVWAYDRLTSLPYCDQCSRYLKAQAKQFRHTSDPKGVQALVEEVFASLRTGDNSGAVRRQGALGNPKQQKGDHLRTVIEVRRCKACGRHWLRFAVENIRNNDWREIPGLSVKGFIAGSVAIEP
jgi:hypothetical protein